MISGKTGIHTGLRDSKCLVELEYTVYFEQSLTDFLREAATSGMCNPKTRLTILGRADGSWKAEHKGRPASHSAVCISHWESGPSKKFPDPKQIMAGGRHYPH